MMKKIVYFVSFLLCFSCMNHRSDSVIKEAVESVDVADEENTVADEKVRTTKKPEVDFSKDYFDAEVEEKLQANFETMLLLKKHPEFKDAITENELNFKLSDTISSIDIKDVEFYGNFIKLNDSITKTKCRFTYLINEKYLRRDSIQVITKRAPIFIDNQLKMNTSFTFKKLN